MGTKIIETGSTAGGIAKVEYKDENGNVLWYYDDAGNFVRNGNAKIEGAGNLLLGYASDVGSGMTGTINKVSIGNTSSSVISTKSFSGLSASHAGMVIIGKSRGDTIGSFVTTQNGDALGYVAFEGVNANATPTQSVGATIEACQNGAAITGAVGTPSNLVFKTSNGSALSEVMILQSDKAVKILSLSGTGNRAVYSDSTGILTNSSSDARVKKNVENLSENINVLDSLKQIRGVTYNWDNAVEGYENMGEQQEIGVIAQEIEQHIPQVVGENNTGYKSVDYAKIVAYLIEVNKALLVKIEALEAKVNYGNNT